MTIKALLLAFLLTWNIVFFLSIFLNTPNPERVIYDENHHYFINRAYPIAWSGVSATDKDLEFPLVKAPFTFNRTFLGNGQEFVKIIDFHTFLITFLVTMIPTFIASRLFLNEFLKNKFHKSKLPLIYILLIFTGIFFYFGWFPRP